MLRKSVSTKMMEEPLPSHVLEHRKENGGIMGRKEGVTMKSYGSRAEVCAVEIQAYEYLLQNNYLNSI